MTDGYVKLWRKLLEWPMWRSMTGDQAKTMITILLMADWKQNGRLVSSQRKIAEKAGVGHKVVRNTEALLEQDHGDGPFLKIDRAQLRAQHLSIYTVCNYKRYQPTSAERGTDQGTAEGEAVPPGAQSCALRSAISIYEELEEEGSAPDHDPSPKKPRKTIGHQQSLSVLPPEAWRLAQLLHDLVLEVDSASVVGGKTWSKQRWAKAFAELPGSLNSAFATIEQVLIWVYRESPEWTDGGSWRDAIRTPAALLKHWDKLRKQMARRAPEQSSFDPRDYAPPRRPA